MSSYPIVRRPLVNRKIDVSLSGVVKGAFIGGYHEGMEGGSGHFYLNYHRDAVLHGVIMPDREGGPVRPADLEAVRSDPGNHIGSHSRDDCS